MKLPKIKPIVKGWFIPGFYGIWPTNWTKDQNGKNEMGIPAVLITLEDFKKCQKILSGS